MFPEVPGGFSINLNSVILLSSLNYRSDHKLIRKYAALFCASLVHISYLLGKKKEEIKKKKITIALAKRLISMMWQ